VTPLGLLDPADEALHSLKTSVTVDPANILQYARRLESFITTVVRTYYLTGVSPSPHYTVYTLLNCAAQLAFSTLNFLFTKLLIECT
jgi:hypothetical protein